MTKTAIKIDLSTFFDDERKMAYILFDPKWKTISCLQNRVEFLFGVKSVRFLSNGYFLPSQESVEIIHLCNQLKAFVPEDALERGKKSKTSKIENSNIESTSNGVSSSSKVDVIKNLKTKRKHGDLLNISSYPAKRAKTCNSSMSGTTSEPELITASSKHISNKLKSRKTVSSVGLNHIEEDNLTTIGENTLVGEYSESQLEKRHSSTLKEKDVSEIVENIEEKTLNDEMPTTSGRQSSIPSSTFLNDNNSLNPNPDRRLKSKKQKKLQKTEQQTGQQTKTLVFRCALQEVTNDIITQIPRIFNLELKNVNNKNIKKQVLEIREQIIFKPIKNNTTNVTLKEKSTLNITNSSTNNIKFFQNVVDNETAQESNVSNLGVSHNEGTNQTTQSGHQELETANETNTMLVDSSDSNVVNDKDDITKKELEESIEAIHDLALDEDEVDKNSSRFPDKGEVINLTETEDIADASINNSKNIIKDITIKKILESSTTLTRFPNVGDIIAFKLCHTNNKLQNCVTDYLAGKIIYIHKRTSNIKIVIIDGVDELSNVPNRFILNLGDTLGNNTRIQIKLDDMTDMKLFIQKS